MKTFVWAAIYMLSLLAGIIYAEHMTRCRFQTTHNLGETWEHKYKLIQPWQTCDDVEWDEVEVWKVVAG